MKVLYDHQIFSTQIYGGISRYFIELIKCFENDDEIEYELSLKYSNNCYLKQLSNFSCNSFFKNYDFKKRDRIINYLNKIISKNIISKEDYDIFHPTYYDPYFLDYIGKKPFVLTIYDMIHEVLTNYFHHKDRVSEYKRFLALKADKIITISENTKKDIIKLYNMSENKIKVIYLASSFNNFNMGKIKNGDIKYKLPRKFILYVGSRWGYKNFYIFMKAIFLLLKNDHNLFIVCAGGDNFNKNEKELLKSLSVQNKVFQYQVDDKGLQVLYKNALAFVFPSLYEGFGIPVLEAFACKCPAIISNTSSLSEVAGDAAIYFDPNDKLSILNNIQKVIYDDELRNQLVYKGSQRVKEFTWEKTAYQTKKLYEGIL
jgi:glycosyltransferase involved in cell wall biosynthesis